MPLMAAADMGAEVLAWAKAEVDAQCFGEEYGVAVSWFPAGVQTPDGPRQVPMWNLLLTARNPLLNEGPLYHGPVPVGLIRPKQEDVKTAVAEGLRQLRDLAASKLATTNGHRPRVPR